MITDTERDLRARRDWLTEQKHLLAVQLIDTFFGGVQMYPTTEQRHEYKRLTREIGKVQHRLIAAVQVRLHS